MIWLLRKRRKILRWGCLWLKKGPIPEIIKTQAQNPNPPPNPLEQLQKCRTSAKSLRAVSRSSRPRSPPARRRWGLEGKSSSSRCNSLMFCLCEVISTISGPCRWVKVKRRGTTWSEAVRLASARSLSLLPGLVRRFALEFELCCLLFICFQTLC